MSQAPRLVIPLDSTTSAAQRSVTAIMCTLAEFVGLREMPRLPSFPRRSYYQLFAVALNLVVSHPLPGCTRHTLLRTAYGLLCREQSAVELADVDHDVPDHSRVYTTTGSSTKSLVSATPQLFACVRSRKAVPPRAYALLSCAQKFVGRTKEKLGDSGKVTFRLHSSHSTQTSST